MNERENRMGYPTNWVSKNDLTMSRPDLSEKINLLNEGDMMAIAKMIGDAVSETHDVAIDEMLLAYLGITDIESLTDNVSHQDSPIENSGE